MKIDSYDFDIFKFRKLCNGNELVSIMTFLAARRGLLTATDVHFTNMMNFLRDL